MIKRRTALPSNYSSTTDRITDHSAHLISQSAHNVHIT
jgi:hypothetical protein